MYIGSRRVRSAGRASGSIEITLPPELTPLEGVLCNIMIRDGARPEIVLKPELSPSALIFARVWGRLHTLFALAGEIGEFPTTDFDVSLLPPTSAPPLNGANRRPTLVYAYAMIVGQAFVVRWPEFSTESTTRGAASSLADTIRTALFGTIQPLASVAGTRLGLIDGLASLFGHMIALLALPADQEPASPNPLAGLPVAADGRFEIAWSQQIWVEICGKDAPPLGVLAAISNDAEAQTALLRIVSQFRDWQEHPERRQTARIAWLAQAPDWFVGAPLSVSLR